MNLTKLLAILKARWIGAVLAVGIGIGAAYVTSIIMPKQYTATAAVLVDTKTMDPLLGGMAALANISTQIEIIKSDRVARRVTRELKLTENGDVRGSWMSATQGSGDFEGWVAELIAKRLEVKPNGQTNIINVAYTSPDPKFASALSNAFVKAYVETTLDLRVDPAKRFNAFFDDRAKALREAVEVAQARLSDYQRANGIIATDERVDIENQRLNELNSQLTAMQAMAAEAQSRATQARNASDLSQDVINNPVVAGLRSEINRQEAKLQELNAKLGDAHPQVVELRANMNEVKQKLESETRRVSSSVGIAGTITNARVADARSALEAQRNKVLKLREQRDAINVLVKEVESSQRAYDAVMARVTQTNLETQSNNTNVTVLAQASTPTTPTSPKPLRQMLMLGALGGLGLGLVYAMLREQLDRRVRSPEDIAELVGLPLLGNLPKPLPGMGSTHTTAFVLPNNVVGRLPSPGR